MRSAVQSWVALQLKVKHLRVFRECFFLFRHSSLDKIGYKRLSVAGKIYGKFRRIVDMQIMNASARDMGNGLEKT